MSKFKINARTFQLALKEQLSEEINNELKNKIKVKLENLQKEKITSWINLNMNEDAIFIHFKKNNKEFIYPFVDENDTFMNILDLNHKSKVYKFSNLEFTKNAFQKTISILDSDEQTKILENKGEQIFKNGYLSEKEATEFCKEVCNWGRQNRVYANIKRYNQNNYGIILSNWINYALKHSNPSQKDIKNIIMMGDDIKGLGVSFASKHLRMLNPNFYPVLDDVLANGLGFALNENGYTLFIQNLNDFKNQNKDLIGNDLNIATIEMILFLLVRQSVRSIQ